MHNPGCSKKCSNRWALLQENKNYLGEHTTDKKEEKQDNTYPKKKNKNQSLTEFLVEEHKSFPKHLCSTQGPGNQSSGCPLSPLTEPSSAERRGKPCSCKIKEIAERKTTETLKSCIAVSVQGNRTRTLDIWNKDTWKAGNTTRQEETTLLVKFWSVTPQRPHHARISLSVL